MVRVKEIPLLEVAELVSAAFDDCPDDRPEDRRGGRLYRSLLLSRLKDRFGDDWVRAWNHVAARRDS